MATYCISDIHGHKDEFDEMLELISFSDDDVLYILGDIIDRGPASAEMLQWAVDEAGDNVHFLLGNHEDMARYVLKRDPEEMNRVYRDDAWVFNNCFDTIEQLRDQTTPEWRREKLVPWLDSLEPVKEDVTVDGKSFALVHAGFDPFAFEKHPEGWEGVNDFIDYDFSDEAFRKTYELPYGLGFQFSQFMLWIRTAWIIDNEPAPVETVFGHTCIKKELVSYMEEAGYTEVSGGGGKIFHFFNKHGIDCGCAYSNRSDFNGTPSLGCLRLEDMAEFYVPTTPYSPKISF